MTTQEKINKIRSECIKVNPEIVELKFGCLVNPDVDSIQFVLMDCIGGTKVIEIINDEDVTVFGNPKLVEVKKVVGRDIRLADVLYMLDSSGMIIGNSTCSEGEIISLDESETLRIIGNWNLLDDNLEHQSEECIDFIYQLIK